MNAPPRIVLDTNILIASIGRSSPLRWIFDALLEGHFTLCLSSAILLEYEAVLTRKTTASIAQNVVRLLAVLPNVERIEPRFYWHLITKDPDDNKFVDTALAAGAHALVTHDAHFDVLHARRFPPLHVIDAEAFRDMLPE